MGKRVKVPISKARAQLFRLADLVRSADDGTRVVLEQRGERNSVALVREARLAYLEDRVNQMDKQQEKPFALAGSLSSALDDAALEQVLRDLRKAWVPAPEPRGRK